MDTSITPHSLASPGFQTCGLDGSLFLWGTGGGGGGGGLNPFNPMLTLRVPGLLSLVEKPMSNEQLLLGLAGTHVFAISALFAGGPM